MRSCDIQTAISCWSSQCRTRLRFSYNDNNAVFRREPLTMCDMSLSVTGQSVVHFVKGSASQRTNRHHVNNSCTQTLQTRQGGGGANTKYGGRVPIHWNGHGSRNKARPITANQTLGNPDDVSRVFINLSGHIAQMNTHLTQKTDQRSQYLYVCYVQNNKLPLKESTLLLRPRSNTNLELRTLIHNGMNSVAQDLGLMHQRGLKFTNLTTCFRQSADTIAKI